MQDGYGAEAEEFRAELRAWLADNVDDDVRGLAFSLEASEAWLTTMRRWNAALADARYAAVDWPREYGGRAAGLVERVIVDQELSHADVPGPLNVIGMSNIAPAILAFGTEAQKRRFLPPMLRGDEVWCQGFSEPDAGSDLASLSTSAVRDGDHYVLNGQKVWTSFGHIADWCELLVRTDPAAPKHKGLSCLLVDMRSPGIEVRPLVTITGEREFNELFFTDVAVPVDALLGEEHAGWRVAMTTLANERGGVANLHRGLRNKIERLTELASQCEAGGLPATSSPVVRQRLARLCTQGEVLRLLAERAIATALAGDPPGPETSLAKVVWSELDQAVCELATELQGLHGLTGAPARDLLASRALTIAGGTTEVNKNVIAQRILGLPDH